MIYLGTFGLEDPIRTGIETPIQLIRFCHSDPMIDYDQKGQVTVRMLTGDHIDTARFVAERCGIVNSSESKKDRIMTGEQFRNAIGDYNIV